MTPSRVFTCVALFALTYTPLVLAQVVTSDEGELIELRDDGTWAKVSQDRFATDAQGRRVRLRPDGTWNIVVPNSDPPAAFVNAQSTVLADEPKILLSKVEIQRRSIKRAKAEHAEFRIHFVVDVLNITDEPVLVPSNLQSQLRVSSNRGVDFEVLDASIEQTQISAGEQGQLDVWAQGAPRWFGTKYLSLVIPAGALGNGVERILRSDMTDVVRVEVQSF